MAKTFQAKILQTGSGGGLVAKIYFEYDEKETVTKALESIRSNTEGEVCIDVQDSSTPGI